MSSPGTARVRDCSEVPARHAATKGSGVFDDFCSARIASGMPCRYGTPALRCNCPAFRRHVLMHAAEDDDGLVVDCA